ncbi:MAG TPA: acyl carrier protein [Solirubrobacteraceae bacterium]|nr:acyl carrier protein [Solirubrobacteraceae bacterium]
MEDTVIRDYIARELVRDPSLLPIENSTPLLDSGILDSLSLLRLVVYLQDQFGVTVGDLDVVPEHFATVDAICDYLRSRRGEGVSAAP